MGTDRAEMREDLSNGEHGRVGFDEQGCLSHGRTLIERGDPTESRTDGERNKGDWKWAECN